MVMCMCASYRRRLPTASTDGRSYQMGDGRVLSGPRDGDHHRVPNTGTFQGKQAKLLLRKHEWDQILLVIVRTGKYVYLVGFVYAVGGIDYINIAPRDAVIVKDARSGGTFFSPPDKDSAFALTCLVGQHKKIKLLLYVGFKCGMLARPYDTLLKYLVFLCLAFLLTPNIFWASLNSYFGVHCCRHASQM